VRVLIADRDPTALEVTALLRRAGHQVAADADAADLPARVASTGVHLFLVDAALVPFPHLVEVCRAVRRGSSALVAVAGEGLSAFERVQLLEAGADDVLARPMDADELHARLRALLRRHPLSLFGEGVATVQVTEELWLDLAGRQLVGGAREVPLTGREFHLLSYLVRHEGAVLGREALLAAVWGPGYEGMDREVDVYVRYLRRKVEPDPSRPTYLLTRRGYGYQYRRGSAKAPSDAQTFPGCADRRSA